MTRSPFPMMYAYIGEQAETLRGPQKAHYEKCTRGADCHNAKLTDEVVRRIRSEHAAKQAEINRLNDTYSAAALAKRYGVTEPTITKVLTYQTWRHVK